jgi:phosphoribosyl-AMP cyclohydrolase
VTERAFADVGELRFDERGLIPAIAQDVDGRVLMLAWMNEATLRETLRGGRMVYWSRSRQERWAKGDTSGDVQLVKEAYYDCDGDVLLFVVEQRGKGACATGEWSCFYRDLRELVDGDTASDGDGDGAQP